MAIYGNSTLREAVGQGELYLERGRRMIDDCWYSKPQLMALYLINTVMPLYECN